LRAPHREREAERRAHPLLALDPDPSAVELHKLPAQGEPEPRALDLLCRRPHLTKLLEDLLLILGGDPNTGVADRDFHESIPWERRDFDASALGRKLDRIRQ